MYKIYKWIVSSQYRYFTRKLKQVGYTIWDMEFKRFKSSEVREEMRQLYDWTKSNTAMLEEKLKTQKEKKDGDPTKMPEGDIARIDDEIVRSKVKEEETLKSVKDMDIQIDGAKPSVDYPDGLQGLIQQIEALRELRQMIEQYLKKI